MCGQTTLLLLLYLIYHQHRTTANSNNEYLNNKKLPLSPLVGQTISAVTVDSKTLSNDTCYLDRNTGNTLLPSDPIKMARELIGIVNKSQPFTNITNIGVFKS